MAAVRIDKELSHLRSALVATAQALEAAGPDATHFERLCEERNTLIRELASTWREPTVVIGNLAGLTWSSVYDIIDGSV